MSKNILILSGSPRKHRNSDLLCDEFQKGAEKSGNTVEKIFLRDKKNGYCTACYYCRDHGGVCAIKDDMVQMLERMNWADVIVIASPVYFYSIDAQVKTVIDRTLAQWTKLENKEFYYILTCADEDRNATKVSIECLRGFAVCLKNSKEKGIIYGTGTYESGSVKTKKCMHEAFDMGEKIN